MRDSDQRPSSSKTYQYDLQETVTQEAANLIQSTYGHEWDAPSAFWSSDALRDASGIELDLFGAGTASPSRCYDELLSALYSGNEDRDSPENQSVLSPSTDMIRGADANLSVHPHVDLPAASTSKDRACLKCNFHARNKTHLWRHNKIHVAAANPASMPTGKSHQCPNCEYTTDSKYNLLRHTQRHHAREKSEVCPTCSKTFKDKDTLRMHVKYVHENRREFPCDWCDKTFVDASGLSRHQRLVHEKSRAFTCPICEKSFQTATNLKRHKNSCPVTTIHGNNIAYVNVHK